MRESGAFDPLHSFDYGGAREERIARSRAQSRMTAVARIVRIDLFWRAAAMPWQANGCAMRHDLSDSEDCVMHQALLQNGLCREPFGRRAGLAQALRA